MVQLEGVGLLEVAVVCAVGVGARFRVVVVVESLTIFVLPLVPSASTDEWNSLHTPLHGSLW